VYSHTRDLLSVGLGCASGLEKRTNPVFLELVPHVLELRGATKVTVAFSALFSYGTKVVFQKRRAPIPCSASVSARSMPDVSPPLSLSLGRSFLASCPRLMGSLVVGRRWTVAVKALGCPSCGTVPTFSRAETLYFSS